MKKNLIYKKKSGITMIALVITIIVLLVLVGISIAVLTGENGIIDKANESREATELGQIKEEVFAKWYELEHETADKFYDENKMAELFAEKLQNTGDRDATVTYNKDNKTFEVFYKGHMLEI